MDKFHLLSRVGRVACDAGLQVSGMLNLIHVLYVKVLEQTVNLHQHLLLNGLLLLHPHGGILIDFLKDLKVCLYPRVLVLEDGRLAALLHDAAHEGDHILGARGFDLIGLTKELLHVKLLGIQGTVASDCKETEEGTKVR